MSACGYALHSIYPNFPFFQFIRGIYASYTILCFEKLLSITISHFVSSHEWLMRGQSTLMWSPFHCFCRKYWQIKFAAMRRKSMRERMIFQNQPACAKIWRTIIKHSLGILTSVVISITVTLFLWLVINVLKPISAPVRWEWSGRDLTTFWPKSRFEGATQFTQLCKTRT